MNSHIVIFKGSPISFHVSCMKRVILSVSHMFSLLILQYYYNDVYDYNDIVSTSWSLSSLPVWAWCLGVSAFTFSLIIMSFILLMIYKRHTNQPIIICKTAGRFHAEYFCYASQRLFHRCSLQTQDIQIQTHNIQRQCVNMCIAEKIHDEDRLNHIQNTSQMDTVTPEIDFIQPELRKYCSIERINEIYVPEADKQTTNKHTSCDIHPI